MNPPVAILVPLYKRIERIPEFAENVRKTTPEATIFFRVAPLTPYFIKPDNAELIFDTSTTYPQGINLLAGRARAEGFKHLFVGAEDLDFKPLWYPKALAKMRGGVQVVGTNDLSNPRVMAGQHATHFLVSSEWEGLEEGTVMSEAYQHQFVDDELYALSNARGVYAHAHDSKVEHLHWFFGKSQQDETYAQGASSFDADQEVFEKRKELWAPTAAIR